MLIYIAHFKLLREDETFLSKIFKNVYIYVTHKECNQKESKRLQAKALKQTKSMIKKLSPIMFDSYKNFIKQLKTDIKKQKTLSNYQARMILMRVKKNYSSSEKWASDYVNEYNNKS